MLRSNISEESANYIDGVHNLSKYGARVVIEPPFLRRFVKTKNWKKALKAQDETLMMGAKVMTLHAVSLQTVLQTLSSNA